MDMPLDRFQRFVKKLSEQKEAERKAHEKASAKRAKKG